MSTHAFTEIVGRLYASVPLTLPLGPFSTSTKEVDQSLWLIGLSSAVVLVLTIFIFYRQCRKLSQIEESLHIVDGAVVKKLLPLPSYWFEHFPHTTSDVSRAPETSSERDLRRQMTSIGRFALRSQTQRNPCVISFFVAMSQKKNAKDMNCKELEDLWGNRVMEKHERFRSRISPEDDHYFEVMQKEDATHIAQVSHPKVYRRDFQERIEDCLTSDLNVTDRLWECQLSTGYLGASGAISHEQIRERRLGDSCDRECLALFRIHHSLADGVSMGVVLADASDEAEELDCLVMDEFKKRRQKHERKSMVQKAIICLSTFVLFYIIGGIKALILQAWRVFHGSNPFDPIIAQSMTSAGQRSVAWRAFGPIEEMKAVAKAISKRTTINDVSVLVVTAAIKRQLAWHYEQTASVSGATQSMPSHVNICVPVHLLGGALVDPKTGVRVGLGNKIGAFVAAIPTEESDPTRPASQRLKKVTAALREQKTTPAPLIAWRAAKFFSDHAPKSIAKYIFRNTNGQAAAVVTNVRGFPFKTHWNGRGVEFLCAFLPLPPGIPVGCVIQSYGGEMSFSVDADKRAVPDAGRFADWMLEEYARLKQESLSKKKQHMS